ncbi:MAG: AraC family transcriptional regulator [Pseudomonadota bacterium]
MKSRTTNYAPAYRQNWHRDDSCRVSIVLAGALAEETRRSSIVAAPLDIVIKSHRIKHENRFGPSGARLFSTKIDPTWLSILPSATGQLDWIWLQARHGCHLAMSLLDSAARKDHNGLESLIIETLAWASHAKAKTGKKGALHRELRLLREQVLDDLNSVVNVGTAARNMGLHPVYLARAYRETFGLSIQDDRQLRRIKLSTEFLSMPEKTIAEVAQEMDFFDQSHFSRVFKRYTGTTPGKYRAHMMALAV